ncbi:importin-11-like [Macrosteles quadrilineatus]|uniref:importin-11-like n=1 Tax=Macrosteles quadrilineatus TaxID=74068 RepID=UPI0023E222DC|nr:importin-11-like [Macrosteles quadrilineatus]XP_054287503.1 importin-11-like [Macrosteles quadrilineatus]
MDLLTAQTLVFETLQQAASQNSDVLKPAEQKLKEWEGVPGFYTILFDIFSTHTVDVNVRWLAVLYFKNGIEKYWRKGATNGISEEEKAGIRQKIASTFNEPVNQIAVQLAVAISKMARLDWPREWGSLMPTLLEAVKLSDPLQQHRALLTLYHVIKALSSKRLIGDRRTFQELTANIYGFMLAMWEEHTCLAISQLQSVGPNNSEPNKCLENAMLSLRILTKLTIHGLKKPHEFPDANTFLKLVFERAKTMLHCRVSTRGELQSQVERCIVKLTKVLLSVLENHPLSFVDCLPATLNFTVHYAFTPEGAPLLFERFLIQCLNLLKGILLCPEYKPAKIIEETKEPDTLRAHQIKMSFFETPILNIMCRKLITHYFLLAPQDLQQWDADPEGFVTDEGGECWKYSLRPCTETLFVGLFHDFRTTLSPLLLQLITENHTPVDPHNLDAILAKDAVYNAVGLAAFDLYDEVNFDEWFTTTLRTELQMKEGNYRVIRRRVAWLVGQWTGVKLSCDLRPALYAAMLPLLRSDEDIAVRLTACSTIKSAVDDFEFNSEQFMEYLDPLFGLLFALLKEVHECDTKMHVLGVLSFVVERVGIAIRPYANSLVQYLPLLWQESTDHNMLRCAIVSTLVHLVKALGTVSESGSLAQFLLGVIQLSTDTQQPSHVYLLEDGLELWLTLLENSATISQPLLGLYNNMTQLLELSSENLRTCFYIIQAYILLAPEIFLQHYGEQVMRSCMYLLTDMRSEGIVMTMRLLELCLKANPTRAVTLLEPVYPRIFQAVYVGEEFPMVMSMYLSIIARVLLISRDMFSRVVVHLAESLKVTLESVTSKILDVWLDKMSLVTQPERSKLLSLALASLITSQSPVVLQRFCSILLSVSEVLNDITRTDDMGLIIDSIMWNGDDLSPNSQYDSDIDYKTEHDQRREQLAASDPVYQLELQKYFGEQLKELQNQAGPLVFAQLLQTVDADTLQQVRDYVPL